MPSAAEKGFASFAEFYPVYLGEHVNRICRVLHFIGSTCALVCIGFALTLANSWWLLGAVVSGYAFAWIGHFFLVLQL